MHFDFVYIHNVWYTCVCVYSPNRACLYGVLAVNLFNWLWSADFFRRRPPHFFHTSLLILRISNPRFQNVAVAHGRVRNPKCVIFFLDCLISKCCCGPHEAQNFDLHHHRSTLVTIKIIKTRQGNASKLECLIFVAERPSSVLAKFHSKHKPFGSA